MPAFDINKSLCAFALLAAAGASTVMAAEKLVESQPLANFQVADAPIAFDVNFDTTEQVTGVGFTGDWTAVVADVGGGVFPWSLDLELRVTSGDGQAQYTWRPIGGDVTIADYPLQDGTLAFAPVSGDQSWEWRFRNVEIDPGDPWIMGLSNVQLHLTTTVPDVVLSWDADVSDGTQWDRPYFIAGVSGLGPTFFRVIEFEVTESGVYRFESVVNTNSAFNYIYKGAFDSRAPLANLFDYGLGNGNAPNGTPNGTSLIEAMLFEGDRYFFVVSQWASYTDDQMYANTVTGPGSLDIIGVDCPGDTNFDYTVDFADLNTVLAEWGTAGPTGDVNDSGTVDFEDLNLVLSTWGDECLGGAS